MAEGLVNPLPPASPVPDNLVVVGRLGAAHGIKGWSKVYSYTAPPENLLAYGELWIRSVEGGAWRPAKRIDGRRQGKILVLCLDGVEDRDQAQRLTGYELAVAKEALPALTAGDYYWHQLQGLVVELANGQRLGRIDHLLETGANDVLVVRGDDRSIDQRERLLPYLPQQVVLDIDLQRGVMRVDWDPDF